jgi:hypothetical protein
MVVARLHEECATCAALEKELRGAIARVPEAGLSAVRHERAERLDAALGRTGAYLAIANRFLQLYEVLDAHGARPDQILGWLEFVQKSGGECQPPFERAE